MHGHRHRRGFGRPRLGSRFYERDNVLERLEEYRRDLEQDGVVVDLADHAEDAADGDDLVADLRAPGHLLLRTLPPLLGADEQEVEDDADQKDREERDQRVGGRLLFGRDDGEVGEVEKGDHGVKGLLGAALSLQGARGPGRAAGLLTPPSQATIR